MAWVPPNKCKLCLELGHDHANWVKTRCHAVCASQRVLTNQRPLGRYHALVSRATVTMTNLNTTQCSTVHKCVPLAALTQHACTAARTHSGYALASAHLGRGAFCSC